ncbi:hydrogenase [Desulfuromonas versatilis]|uniref:Hydrogenase n=1 Tax=Desulfuromonas versatilis TaxID=2802975 RepID=A0ABM8HPN5_9BACT|nr:proton-conducting transporter membrane subunit [Desulfuromonas versatilis]BCR03681.1 hydrogenase [Desulfuromonas versatilis]
MSWLLAGIGLIMTAGLSGLLAGRQGGGGEKPACALLLAGTLLAGGGIAGALAGKLEASLRLPWPVPGGELALGIDGISALFLFPLLLIAAAGSLFGLGYWTRRHHPRGGRRLRLFYGLITAAMLLLLVARNGLLFLVAWEIMALSGFFLITTEEHKGEARRAGLIYLAATHTGTLALFALFALLEQAAGSFAFPAGGTLAAGGAPLFLLGLAGFGLKAGLMPLHIWLPGAHAAAPSHASALLSGAMIKTGIYGLVRLSSFFAEIPPWWGWTVLALGALSGVLGVVLALAQHDIKRLLAYHSVENIGIIALGLGIALLGRSHQVPELVLLGIGGALLHVVNHGLFKSLLFLSAGSLIHATGTREIDQMGGLLRRQPWTGVCFLGGAVAICGLPPFNGFVSEWLIYLGAFRALRQGPLALQLAAMVAPALALIGALALACFVKVFGIAFLGEPRSDGALKAREAGPAMRWPMALLFGACAWIGLLPWTLAPLLQRAALDWSPLAAAVSLAAPLAPLHWVGLGGWLLVLALAGCGGWLAGHSRRAPRDVATWGCGFARPTTRMQYSASSFADFLAGLFRCGLLTERHGGRVEGLHPGPAELSTHTPDAVLDRVLLPASGKLAWLFTWLRAVVQNGRVGLYLLYLILTLLALLGLVLLT